MTIETRFQKFPIEGNNILHEIKRSEITGRTFDEYCGILSFSKDGLEGKTILDVGSGLSDFTRKAKRYGANVIKVDGAYSIDDGILFSPWEREDAIGAVAQYLPFKNNIFDETIAVYSLYHIKTGLAKTIQEMIRVTKPNGKIRIHPVYNIGFTYTFKKEPALSLIEDIDGANTLIVDKSLHGPSFKWGKLADRIASSFSFRDDSFV